MHASWCNEQKDNALCIQITKITSLDIKCTSSALAQILHMALREHVLHKGVKWVSGLTVGSDYTTL